MSTAAAAAATATTTTTKTDEEAKVKLNEVTAAAIKENAIPVQNALNALEKLQRFCYIGALDEPVFKCCNSLDLNVENYVLDLQQLCEQVKAKELTDCLVSLLHHKNADYLPRRDEALLVLTVYLSTCEDECQRTVAREEFPLMVTKDADLLQLSKYARRVQKILQRNTPFNRTIRKAIIEWYKIQPVDRLLQMYFHNDCERNSHRDLMYHCHYTDEKFDEDVMAAIRLIFTPPNEVIAWPDYLQPLHVIKDYIVGVAQVRVATKAKDVVPIVKRLQIPFEQIPRPLLVDPVLIGMLLSKMSYEHLLQSWPRFHNSLQLHAPERRKFTELFYVESKLAAANVAPLRLLLQEVRMVKRKKYLRRGVMTIKPPTFMAKLYKYSFGKNKAIDCRFHITLNLEKCYRDKYLNGRWRAISYLDAIVALAFAYYKSESQVNVRMWYDKSGKLKTVPWTASMTCDQAKYYCFSQNIAKIKQTLTDVIDDAELDLDHVYDVFLVVVPCATRGNPQNNSNELCQRLNAYREKRNPNAKFIIISLRQTSGSMSYSKQLNEHILELCGMCEEMPKVINAFATGKFV
ncbi:uncharacterized protein LOC133847710 [Drosophila sulfurigaster albostrigata]|uniref:uncharacterized protein LOC133847710 n=1 Tax=Drosophila sulfurigaster albostrigata TaxID=89887 RepID=UPI002D219644|nr:uncharacterized protein LOC133847710 [Drosophila sulfurigaster albostrigata]